MSCEREKPSETLLELIATGRAAKTRQPRQLEASANQWRTRSSLSDLSAIQWNSNRKKLWRQPAKKDTLERGYWRPGNSQATGKLQTNRWEAVEKGTAGKQLENWRHTTGELVRWKINRGKPHCGGQRKIQATGAKLLRRTTTWREDQELTAKRVAAWKRRMNLQRKGDPPGTMVQMDFMKAKINGEGDFYWRSWRQCGTRTRRSTIPWKWSIPDHVRGWSNDWNFRRMLPAVPHCRPVSGWRKEQR